MTLLKALWDPYEGGLTDEQAAVMLTWPEHAVGLHSRAEVVNH